MVMTPIPGQRGRWEFTTDVREIEEVIAKLEARIESGLFDTRRDKINLQFLKECLPVVEKLDTLKGKKNNDELERAQQLFKEAAPEIQCAYSTVGSLFY